MIVGLSFPQKMLIPAGNYMFKVNNKDTSGIVLVSLLLILNIFHTFFWCFYCQLWAGKCRLGFNPVNIYLFKVNNRNTRKSCEICSKLTKTPELMFLMLTLSKKILAEILLGNDLIHLTSLVSFYTPLKTSANQSFSDVFREHRKRPLAWNRLRKFHKFPYEKY